MLGFWGHLGSAFMAIMPFASRFTEGGRLSDPGTSAHLGGGLPGQQENGKVSVTETTALNLSAVWSAVRVISGAIAVMPLHCYRKGPNEARSRETTAPGSTLGTNPNSEMTAITFWETLLAHALTWGGGHAEIERDQADRPIGLWPVLPNRIRPARDESGELYYQAKTPDGQLVKAAQRDIFHVPGLGFDGLKGYSVVTMARRSLGIAATAEQAGENFFAEGMRPSGYMKFKGSLAELQKLNLEESMNKKHAGARRFGRNAILYGGLEYQSLGIEPRDAQFLETRVFQIVEVARWFNIPPHMLRDLTRATFSNIEHQSQDFVTYTLLYWMTKVAQEFQRKILGNDDLYAEHNAEILLRGDTTSRYQAYASGRQWGWLSSNDVRRKENMPPREGGDDYLTPVNMAVDGAPVIPTPVQAPVPEEPDEDLEEEDDEDRDKTAPQEDDE